MRGFASRGNLAGHDFDGSEEPIDNKPLITPIKHKRLQELATRLGLLRGETSDTALSSAETALPGQTDRVILKTALKTTVGKAVDTKNASNEGLIRPPGEGRI